MNTKKNFRIKFFILFTVLLTLCLTACSSEPMRYQYGQPDEIDDGLAVGTLEDAGIDVEVLGRGIDRIRDGKYGEIHSLLVYKEGKLVVEEYFPGHKYKYDGPNHHGAWVNWNQDMEHKVFSAGKSITSSCVAIAIDQGFIESVDQSIFDYLPEYQHLNTGGKEDITIEHLLTMTSGLKWNEWGTSYADKNNDLVAIWDCDDPVECILDRPLASKPGTEFKYSGGDMTVLGKIIQNATGLDIEAFAGEYLFAPMGIETPPWLWMDDTGVIYAGGEQKMTPREMLKFGVTYLNNGVWDNQQIIPEEWVYLSSVPYGNNTSIRVPGSDGGRRGYGYTWWLWDTKLNGEKLHTFTASGWGGQKIIIIPDLDIVIVFTGGNFTSKTYNFSIMEKYILDSISGD